MVLKLVHVRVRRCSLDFLTGLFQVHVDGWSTAPSSLRPLFRSLCSYVYRLLASYVIHPECVTLVRLSLSLKFYIPIGVRVFSLLLLLAASARVTIN